MKHWRDGRTRCSATSPPERFIPIAESSGLIRELGDWLLRCAASDAMAWPAHVMLSFNISPEQLKDRTLGLRILGILGETGLSPNRFEIEITESAIVRDLETAREVLSSLRDAGIRIALDDFGTGYSQGCQQGQGFLFSRAVPAEETAALFAAKKNWKGGQFAA